MDYHCCYSEGKDIIIPRDLQGFRGLILYNVIISLDVHFQDLCHHADETDL